MFKSISQITSNIKLGISEFLTKVIDKLLPTPSRYRLLLILVLVKGANFKKYEFVVRNKNLSKQDGQ